MKRDVSLEEISDGRLYSLNDMVKADTGGCTECSECCRGMGKTIILNPFDLHRLCIGLHTGFDELMEEKIELNLVDGLILPNLKMSGQEEEQCSFLSEKGRCTIHSFRPEICRLFPLGRYYENGDFQYFLQVHECSREKKAKVKVKKWIGSPDLKRHEQFIRDWHYFLNDCEKLAAALYGDNLVKELNLYLLTNFYRIPFDEKEYFYGQFEERLASARVYARRLQELEN